MSDEFEMLPWELKPEVEKCELDRIVELHDPQAVNIMDPSLQITAGLEGLSVGGILPAGRPAATAGNSPDTMAFGNSTTQYNHNFPPSPPFASAVPVENMGSPVMPQASMEGNNTFLDESNIAWLTNNFRYQTRGPLDLRPNLESEMISWGRKEFNEYVGSQNSMEQLQSQEQQPHQLQQQQSRLTSCNFISSLSHSSPVSFSTSDDCDSSADMPTSFNHSAKVIKIEKVLNDDQLIKLTVRDLNRRLHGYPSEVVKKLKQKRRTLKNRGYAQNCRSKRIALKCQLEKTNEVFKSEIDRLRHDKELLMQDRQRILHDKERALQDRDRALHERDVFKQQLEMLRARDCTQTNDSLAYV